MRVLAVLGLLLLSSACGVRAAPRPPHPEARPQTGDPLMVRTNAPPDTAPAATYPTGSHTPSYDGGLPPWQKPTGSPETGGSAKPEETSPDQEREK